MDLTSMMVEIWSGVLGPIYSFFRTALLCVFIALILFIGSFVFQILPAIKNLIWERAKRRNPKQVKVYQSSESALAPDSSGANVPFDINAPFDAFAEAPLPPEPPPVVPLIILFADQLAKLRIRFMPYDLARWLLVDFCRRSLNKNVFREYGITFYVGRQGGGKTASMLRYMRRMRAMYPKLLIVSNIKTSYNDVLMRGWNDFLTYRNGTDGVLFCIDEIQSEYSSKRSKDFPDTLLRHICMQRKQRIKIVCTAQYFSRVAKSLREQANDVVVCSAFAGRLVTLTAYDAVDYEAFSGGLPVKMAKKKRLSKLKYVMGDNIRNSYDTYEVVQKLESLDYEDRVGDDYER